MPWRCLQTFQAAGWWGEMECWGPEAGVVGASKEVSAGREEVRGVEGIIKEEGARKVR